MDRIEDGQDQGTSGTASDCLIVYFSSVSENTKRFVDRLGYKSERIPLTRVEGDLLVSQPYVLFVPTYGGGRSGKRHVPPQVVKFLNIEQNRNNLLGIIGSGNKNFGPEYCAAANIVSQKCKVPVLYRFELLGTDEDVSTVKEGLNKFWTQHRNL